MKKNGGPWKSPYKVGFDSLGNLGHFWALFQVENLNIYDLNMRVFTWVFSALELGPFLVSSATQWNSPQTQTKNDNWALESSLKSVKKGAFDGLDENFQWGYNSWFYLAFLRQKVEITGFYKVLKSYNVGHFYTTF